VGGLPWLTPRTSAGLSPKEAKKIIFYFLFLINFFLLAAGDHAGLRGAACAKQHKNKKNINKKIKNKKKYIVYFLFFLLATGDLAGLRGAASPSRTTRKKTFFFFFGLLLGT
jgi:hypothetical protein